ncbi:MAG: metallophosphoesterase [Eubacterium sp.]|nr:metallophosphoesterase [Eubacterium sp.]
MRSKKLLSMLMVAALTVSTYSAVVITEGGEVTQNVTYQFANTRAGSAAGTISVTTENAGTYELYWGDGEGQKLKSGDVEFTELGTVTTTEDDLTADYKFISPYTVIPEGAKEVLVEDSTDTVVDSYTIPENKLFAEGEQKYTFALMSDVHFNRYSDFSADDAVKSFDDALAFIHKQGVKQLFLTGDLSNQGEIDSYNKFNKAIGKYKDLTVYTCMGNHDVSWTKNAEKEVKLFAANINKTRTTDKNVVDVCANGVDFVYRSGDDYHIFLSQTKASYGKGKSLLADDQLNWFHKTLNKYANKKVYVYFHTYLAAEGGDVTKSVGNLETPLGYTYDLTYVYGNQDEQRLRNLLRKYANVTLFTGHSHWAYEEQVYNPYLNIGNISKKNDGASLVHLASVSQPRTAVLDKELFDKGTKRYENNGVKSEGTVATRYANSTVYYSTDFVTGKYMASACYIDPDGKKGTPEKEISTGATKIKKVSKPKKMKKSSKKKPKYQVTVKFAKVNPVFKYQVQYSTDKNFKASKTKSKVTAKTSYTITGLKAGTKYYIRVRAYRYQFGYQIFGTCKNKKHVKTPKKKKK